MKYRYIWRAFCDIPIVGEKGKCINPMNGLLKKIALVSAGVLMLLSVWAQTNRAALEDVINAIKNNRVHDMTKYFDNFVPITISNNQAVYSHNQAEVVLNDFLSKNPPKDFQVMDSGVQTGNAKFAIAEFNSPGGRYSVYILMKMKDKNYLVKEIRISKE